MPLRGEIHERRRAERAAFNDLHDTLQCCDALATKAGIVAGRSLQRRHHRVPGGRKAAGEPQAREGAATGEKNSHAIPRNNSVPWKAGSKSGQTRSFAETSTGALGQTTPKRGSSKRMPRSSCGA